MNRQEKTATNRIIKEQFGREAEKYGLNSPVHAKKEDIEFVTEFLNPQNHWKSWSALDIAIGAGNMAFIIAPFVNSVVASDITEEMLIQTQKNAKIKNITNLITKKADVHSLPFDANIFDFTSVRIAPHHFHDPQVAVQEMVRVTRSGGLIFLQDTMAPSDKETAQFINHLEKLRDPSHLRTLSQKEWTGLFIENDCEILRLEVKSKTWLLGWWAEQMSTPLENVHEILKLIDEVYPKHAKHIDIRKDENNEWILEPMNIYLLVRKLETKLG